MNEVNSWQLCLIYPVVANTGGKMEKAKDEFPWQHCYEEYDGPRSPYVNYCSVYWSIILVS